MPITPAASWSHWAHQWPGFGWLIPVCLAALMVTLARWLVQRFAPVAAGSGVQHIEAVMRAEAEPAPLAVLPVKFVGGTLAIGAGLALGREGPTVQMGASVGSLVARLFRASTADQRLLNCATGGAGLSVAFNALWGGLVFVFEEVARRFEIRLTIAALAACGTAIVVSRALLGDLLVFEVSPLAPPTDADLLVYLILGALIGVAGALFNQAVTRWLSWFDWFARVPGAIRAAVLGATVGLLAWFDPHFVGGGENIVQGVLDGQFTVSSLALLFAVRWVLGPFSYSAGTPGGLCAPLLLVGATFGALFGDGLRLVLPTLPFLPALPPTDALAVVGMAAFFTTVVRAPLTGMVLVIEMTNSTTLMVPMMAACLTATLVPTLLGSQPIYDTLRERMLARGRPRY